MEQTSSVVMSMLQTMAGQAGLPKTNKNEGGELGDFQKLLEEKAQEKDPLMEQPAKAETKPQAAAPKKDKAPAEKQENPVERIKKLAEQGYPVVQPSIAMMTLDGQVYQPGEYVEVWTPNGVELFPITGLDGKQMQELQQIMDSFGPVQTIDVSDPEADAMLEATDPAVEHGPAELLEKAVAEEAGQTVQQAMEGAGSQEGDDPQAEVIDVEQAPQQLFRDVEAAPVKVGEAYDVRQTEGADVAQQIDAQLAQALQKGESVVRVQLTPENLGEVTVEIRQSVDGILHVALNAHSPETRSLLERHAGELQGLLSSRGQQEVQVDVQRGQESQQNQNQQHQQNYDGHNGHAQDGQEQERRQRREHTSSQDFLQQLRLGLIPTDGEF